MIEKIISIISLIIVCVIQTLYIRKLIKRLLDFIQREIIEKKNDFWKFSDRDNKISFSEYRWGMSFLQLPILFFVIFVAINAGWNENGNIAMLGFLLYVGITVVASLLLTALLAKPIKKIKSEIEKDFIRKSDFDFYEERILFGQVWLLVISYICLLHVIIQTIICLV